MLDFLSDILNKLSFKGTLYFRTSFTQPWGVTVPEHKNVARFHFADRGECLVKVKGSDQIIRLAQGDLIIIPHGAAHQLFCSIDNEVNTPPLEKILQDSGYTGEGVLVYGGEKNETETQLVCGHFSFSTNMKHAFIKNLPAYIHIQDYGSEAGKWMEYTLRMISAETKHDNLGGNLIALKMAEIIFAQAIRSYLNGPDAIHEGLSGFTDPNLSRALTAFHKEPAKHWTVETLAREAGLSRTSFAQNFSKLMHMTPMQYLTSWRMELAKEGLAKQKMTIPEVSILTGYSSESAFSRTFKKEVGQSPSSYKRNEC